MFNIDIHLDKSDHFNYHVKLFLLLIDIASMALIFLDVDGRRVRKPVYRRLGYWNRFSASAQPCCSWAKALLDAACMSFQAASLASRACASSLPVSSALALS